MTMPHLSNCPHSADGWCLPCVGELWESLEETRFRVRLLEIQAERLASDVMFASLEDRVSKVFRGDKL
jgi:hypothetical protein